MRKSSLLDALFPNVRQEIHGAALLRPEKWWYLSELGTFLRKTPSSLQRELTALVRSGILEQRRDGRRSYFRAEARSPIFCELRGLFEKTAGMVPALRRVLNEFGCQIDCAFVYGSVAKSEEGAESDVDLMVIGTVGLAGLSPVLRRLEARLGREINVTNYTPAEFRSRSAANDHFITTVLREKKLFVKGTRDDLERIAGRQGYSKA
jgi:predicted nucleotidyltransferase